MNKDRPIGGKIITQGNSTAVKTGSWKTFAPNWDKKRCIQCLICAIYCPESAISVKNDQRKETDMDYCKGCGICAQICPVKCITMEKACEEDPNGKA
jgi:pyruvate ferredoxin oxidoreductase delta subunit